MYFKIEIMKKVTLFAIALNIAITLPTNAADYVIVDTGQDHCYDTTQQINCPNPGEPFYGQDAQYDGNQPSYTLSGDGLTVYDNNTGLRWIRTPDTDGDGDLDTYDQLTWSEFLAYPVTLNAQNYGGYDDWHLPSIKELYSLIDFNGNVFTLTPYIDTNYFDFAFGDTTQGERIIDAQYWSSAQYVGLTMNGDTTVFGVNFADGRIKGYPRDTGPGGVSVHYARYVSGNTDYGTNDFVDNGDGTITDLSTGLMWQKSDDGVTRNWEEALEYSENLTLSEYDDWRLPNAKELQSLVDYNKAPDATDSENIGPAIDTIFEITNIGSEQEPEYGYFWANTTHLDGPAPGNAIYISFGQALGWMQFPPGSGNYRLLNVHGAGAQRSDPKSGNPDDYPHGRGPQGDVIRIYNFVRCVRGDGVVEVENDQSNLSIPEYFNLYQNKPNPFNPTTSISFDLPESCEVSLKVYNLAGQLIETLVNSRMEAGYHLLNWDASTYSSGIYFYKLIAGDKVFAKHMTLLK